MAAALAHANTNALIALPSNLLIPTRTSYSIRDKLHSLSSSLEMSFLKLYLCNVVFCTQLTSFTMLLYISFHTYPIVELSDCSIHSGETIVSTMIMCCHQNVIYQRFWQYYWSEFITCSFHNSSFENTIFD